ncbi:hypothetical protein FH972_027219 [Carpinus fangiana]|uniref:Uncharacterized protein n=1 Tax=Carpinus fangiana TaxID=176857 RepID=A0A5N6L6F3_9ROSI|nr:hypothetical protein FH972_027219 [Carpinus fangiana]
MQTHCTTETAGAEIDMQTLERRVTAVLSSPEGDGVGAGLKLGIVEAVAELLGTEKALLQ